MSLFPPKKMAAGALQYALFVSVLIALFLSAFLLFSYMRITTQNKVSFQLQCIQNTDQGFHYMATNKIPYHTKTLVAPTLGTAFSLSKKRWGIFDLLLSESVVQQKKFKKVGLIGGGQKERPSLYLQERNHPLVLVGNTQISGKAYLPEKGVKSGYIGGTSYMGSSLIYGTTALSSPLLPVVENWAHLSRIFGGVPFDGDTLFFEPSRYDNKVRTFFKEPLVYEQKGPIELVDLKLTGNFIIRSDTLIRVHRSALLQDLLLVAPSIEVLSGVRGNFQAMASESIRIGSHCDLTYPSGLILTGMSSEISSENPQIRIDKNTTVRGVIGYFGQHQPSHYQPQIVLETHSLVKGEVYCTGYFELKGTVLGSVYTGGFIANRLGSIYQNHIYNGAILSTVLPVQYAGLILENTNLKIAKWLY